MASVLLALNTNMTKELGCADVFKGCSYVGVGSDIRELMADFMANVRNVHRITRPTPELRIQAMEKGSRCGGRGRVERDRRRSSFAC